MLILKILPFEFCQTPPPPPPPPLSKKKKRRKKMNIKIKTAGKSTNQMDNFPYINIDTCCEET
jgi:hypothetical protein